MKDNPNTLPLYSPREVIHGSHGYKKNSGGIKFKNSHITSVKKLFWDKEQKSEKVTLLTTWTLI